MFQLNIKSTRLGHYRCNAHGLFCTFSLCRNRSRTRCFFDLLHYLLRLFRKKQKPNFRTPRFFTVAFILRISSGLGTRLGVSGSTWGTFLSLSYKICSKSTCSRFCCFGYVSWHCSRCHNTSHQLIFRYRCRFLHTL